MKIIITLFTTLLSIIAYSQDPYLEFNERDYPASCVRNMFYNFNKYKIEVIHATSDYNRNNFSCRIWVIVKSGKTIIDKLYYGDCPGVGGCSGIFISKQNRNDYFIISKLGNYSGQVIIVDTTGKLKTYGGGTYYYSVDNNFLFTVYDSDISGITVFDFAKNNSIYSSEISNGYLEKLYYNNKKYYFTISMEGTDTPINEMLLFDPDDGRITRTVVDSLLIKKAQKIVGYNKFTYGPCNCGITK